MKTSRTIELIVDPSENGIRLDRYLNLRLPEHSRTFYQKLIDRHMLKVADKPVKAAYRVSTGERIQINYPEPEITELIPENLPIDIIHEDRDIVVVNKAAGMVVHPGAGVHSGTLVNALMYCVRDLSGVGGRLRPGIIHRLDKQTSGLLLVAKNDTAHLALSHQLSRHSIRREYQALVWHVIKSEQQTIETLISRSKRDRKIFTTATRGKPAVTHFQVEKRYAFLTRVRINLHTGRTHQIRVHFNHIHHPIFGDPQYNGRQKQIGQICNPSQKILAKKLLQLLPRQALHAAKIKFIHPISQQAMEFESPLPADMLNVFDELEKNVF